ncbi:Protein VAC14-like protein [Zea mays]|uniref:Protein VAC14-like protein n=1 Tax=Zea mays TaxID=4577 RepID=A0A1D6P1K7_MAIZE|nr:Protein VAC14-like protein [Zea mays]
MNVLNPYVRQILVGWITVLDSVPDIDMLGFLPDFLDGNPSLFPSALIFYTSIDRSTTFLSPPLQTVEAVLIFAKMLDLWLSFKVQINEFVKLGGEQLVPYYADILYARYGCNVKYN